MMKEKRLETESLTGYLDPQSARALKTHLGIETVGEFLEFYPRKYLPRGELTPFSELVEGQEATIIARVYRVSTRSLRSRRGSITEITITDQLHEEENPNEQVGGNSGKFVVDPHRADYRYAGRADRTPNVTHPRIYGSAAGYSDSYRADSSPDLFYDTAQITRGNSTDEGKTFVGESRTMTLSFFNAWTAAREIHEGDRVMFSGKVSTYRGELTLTNPHYAVLADTKDCQSTGEGVACLQKQANAPIPVYRASSKLPTDRIATAIEQVLDRVNLNELEDPVPPKIRKKRKIPGLAWTYRAVHTPDSEETWRAAHYFLRYREAFVLQAALARMRAVRAAQETVARPLIKGGFAELLLTRLPYELTVGQKKVGQQISADLADEVPMNRLLQGEVGSGKTVVALLAMLQVVDTGGQAAMLAPTEVLAEQHYRSVLGILGRLAERPYGLVDNGGTESLLAITDRSVRVVLLKSSMPTKIKKQALLDIASGTADIVIGTHALLAETVAFADLGMVVVDEQHRFGVEQRDALRGTDGKLPHRLVMTATPIPRTVAMTVFGDLDISVLDQIPAGRQKIQTVVVPLAEHPRWEKRLWERAREEIDAGHQVYVVVPKIGDGDSAEDSTGYFFTPEENTHGQLSSVVSMLDQLSDLSVLSGTRIKALHGRMDTAEKSQVMQQFERGEIDLLVCTTVIEVGVNVPNATLMVVMDADRFGISGLHQLRGRIGRGSLPGTCLLVTAQGAGGVSRDRLDAVASTTDGFELSRIDLQQRREGDILGAAQSGKKSRLKLLRALADIEVIEKARDDARAVVDEDPTFATYHDLAHAIDRVLDADREAFLGRG